MKTLTTLCLLINFSAVAQHAVLTGHVIDNDRHTFGGLQIELLQGDSVITGVFTDLNGDYMIYNIKPGSYTFRIRHPGYREQVIKDISVSAGESKRFDFTHPGPCVDPKKVCPNGQHENNIIPIVYGLPGPKMKRKASRGKIWLGGCVRTDCDPKWYCKDHKTEF